MTTLKTQWVVVFLLGMCGASLLHADPAKVEHLRGQVEQRSPTDIAWKAVDSLSTLEEGSSIRTGLKSSVEIIASQGHRFKVGADSIFRLLSLQQNKTLAALDSGRVLSKIKHLKSSEQLAVQTPTAVCAVRGTEFMTAVDHEGATRVDVFKGFVAVTVGEQEIAVHAGESLGVSGKGEIGNAPRSSAGSGSDSSTQQAAKREVGLAMSREEVMAAGAAEIRMAEYVEGKSLIDVSGKRVRLEEYIVRPAANQFKFVVLNERDSRLDYFFYKGIFNQNLPADLSVALRDLSGKYGTAAPTYFLTSYEMGQSNVKDSIHDTATGGHLVKIAYNTDGTVTLTDAADATHTKTVTIADLKSDGTYTVYNPLSDSFSTGVTAAQLANYSQFGIYLPENDSFRDLAPGDTFWKTRFNTYEHLLNTVSKVSYVQGTTGVNNLVLSQDATYTYAGGFVVPVVVVDANNIDATITNYYGDGTFERYRTVLIDDNGKIAPNSAFAGISTGAAYKGELLKWNYEQQVTATEFGGRKIDLVVEPKIFIKSGLIQ